jgi:Cu(I)/Ag(I) efflux system membrane protein CusA/SilA
MKRIAAPMIGGLFTSFLMELLVYPAVYLLWRWHTEVKQVAAGSYQAAVPLLTAPARTALP